MSDSDTDASVPVGTFEAQSWLALVFDDEVMAVTSPATAPETTPLWSLFLIKLSLSLSLSLARTRRPPPPHVARRTPASVIMIVPVSPSESGFKVVLAFQSWSLVFGGCTFLPFSGSLVFGGFAFPPVSLGPAGDCPCKD